MAGLIKRLFLENRFMALVLCAYAAYILILRFAFGIAPALAEAIGIAFGIVALDLMRRQKVANFVMNILLSSFLIWWFASIGLFAMVAMRVVMIAISLMGIYFWRRPRADKKILRPSWLGVKKRAAVFAGLGLLFVIAAAKYGLVSAMDATYAAVVLAGQALLARKKIDGWTVWLAGDMLIGLPLFFITGSWASLFFCVFLIATEISSIKSWGAKK